MLTDKQTTEYGNASAPEAGQGRCRLLYGTGNPAKLTSMRRRLAPLDIELIGLKDMDTEPPQIAEDGSTPLENAVRKATAYYNAYHIPVFSCDTGLYIDGLPDSLQPGVHVRTIHGKYLTDEEMMDYYSGLAERYGDLTARYRNAVCYVKDDTHIYQAMEESMASEPFILTAKPHSKKNQGFPLDSLSIDIKTGKYFYDLAREKRDTVAVEDGFLAFFQKCL